MYKWLSWWVCAGRHGRWDGSPRSKKARGEQQLTLEWLHEPERHLVTVILDCQITRGPSDPPGIKELRCASDFTYLTLVWRANQAFFQLRWNEQLHQSYNSRKEGVPPHHITLMTLSLFHTKSGSSQLHGFFLWNGRCQSRTGHRRRGKMEMSLLVVSPSIAVWSHFQICLEGVQQG